MAPTSDRRARLSVIFALGLLSGSVQIRTGHSQTARTELTTPDYHNEDGNSTSPDGGIPTAQQAADATDNRTVICIASMTPMTVYGWSVYARSFPAILQAALDDALKLPNMLSGYRLQLVNRDTQGRPSKSIEGLFKFLQSYKCPILLGPSRSETALAVSQAVHNWNIVQMVYSTRSSYFTDRVKNPNVFMTNFLTTALNPLKIAIMKYYGWSRVATATNDDEIHLSETSDFHKHLSENNFTLLTSGILHSTTGAFLSSEESVANIIQRFRQYKARIIFISLTISDLAFVMCEAYRQGLTGRGYVWISVGHTAPSNWQGLYAPAGISCTEEELRLASDGLLALDHPYLRMDNGSSITGKNAESYAEWVQTLDYPEGYKYPRLGPFAYDAGLAVAIALNTTVGQLNDSRLEDFDYDRADIGDVIKRSMESTFFQGVTGPVFFNNDGSRKGLAYLVQINAYTFERRQIAVFDPQTGTLTKLAEVKWKGLLGDALPVDHFTYETRQVTLPRGIMVTFGILAVLGVMLALGFLAFNVTKRHLRVIKMSSPTINNVILLGAMVTYISVFMYSLGPQDTDINACMAKIWLASLGYTTGFGAMFSKTWRVHVLFKNETLKKKIVKDKALLALVMVLVAIDFLLLITWTLWQPLDWKIAQETKELDSEHLYIVYEYPQCYHENQNYWFGALYIYKGLLLVFGLFLTWETRMVTIPALNDSKYIGFAVYNVVVVCVFGVPTAHVLNYNQITVRFCLVSLLFVFCTTCTLCLVFVPKVLMLHRPDNQGQGTFRFTGSGSAGVSGISGAATSQNLTPQACLAQVGSKHNQVYPAEHNVHRAIASTESITGNQSGPATEMGRVVQ